MFLVPCSFAFVSALFGLAAAGVEMDGCIFYGAVKNMGLDLDVAANCNLLSPASIRHDETLYWIMARRHHLLRSVSLDYSSGLFFRGQ